MNHSKNITEAKVGRALQPSVQEEKNTRMLMDMMQQLEAIRMSVEQMSSGVKQVPDMLEMTTDAVDKLAAKARAGGIDLEERGEAVMQLLERLTQPKTIEKLNMLIDISDQLPIFVADTVNIVDDGMDKLHQRGIDVHKTAENVEKVLIAANTALQETLEESPKKIGGVLGLLRQLNDKDFQKVLAFLTTFGKYFGRHLGK